MRCDTGQFKDKRVRQALALTIDRPALIQSLFKGKAVQANDHVICAGLPVLQRHRRHSGPGTSPRPSSSCADAGVPSLKATLQYGKLTEIPDLAVLLKSQAAEAGITLEPAGTEQRDVLRRPVVP